MSATAAMRDNEAAIAMMDKSFGLGADEAHNILRTNAAAKRIYDCAIAALAGLRASGRQAIDAGEQMIKTLREERDAARAAAIYDETVKCARWEDAPLHALDAESPDGLSREEKLVWILGDMMNAVENYFGVENPKRLGHINSAAIRIIDEVILTVEASADTVTDEMVSAFICSWFWLQPDDVWTKQDRYDDAFKALRAALAARVHP